MNKEPSVEELIEEFKYCVPPTDVHRELLKEMKAYYEENEKFMLRWNFQAGRRARRHLNKIWHLVRERRYEIADVMYREGKSLDRARPDKREYHERIKQHNKT